MAPRSFGMLLAVVCCSASAWSAEGLLPATQTFLDSLDETQRKAVLMPFNAEDRLNWHFVPKKRAGLALEAMTDEQQQAVMAMLKAGLSEAGYEKAETIRSLEKVLKRIEGFAFRNPELYNVLVFGDPEAEGNWTLRYEGHHISFNWTFVEGELVSGSPQFLGANPAEVRGDDPLAGTRALAKEEDLARTLVQSLDEAQRAQAIADETAPRDILTSNQSTVEPLDNKGISYTALTEAQQGTLISLIEAIARVQPAPLAQKRLDDLREAGLDNVRFTWMGGLEPGQGHYYSVEGPTFLIEYDNTQNDANHIHTVWRDYDGDFGRDVLKDHYARVPHPEPLLRAAGE